MASADTHVEEVVPTRTAFAAMLRAGVVVSTIAYPIVVIAFWIARGPRGGAAAAIGALLAIVFFAAGLMVMGRIVNSHPVSVLAGAFAVYLGQVLFLGIVIFSLSGQDWLDGLAFGLAVLAIALVWQIAQVTAFLRAPKPVYDLDQQEVTRG